MSHCVSVGGVIGLCLLYQYRFVKANRVNLSCIAEQHLMTQVLRRLKPNVGSMPAMLLMQTQVCPHPIITDVHSLFLSDNNNSQNGIDNTL